MAASFPPERGYLGMIPNEITPSVLVIDNVAHRVVNSVVHQFTVSDLDDPDMYASGPMWEWEKSEAGAWVMEHAVETPMWHRNNDYSTYGIKYAITARLKEVDYTYYLLKYT
jgi:hypothetical protein